MLWHEEATMKSETKKMISVFLVSFLLFGCNGNSESKVIRMDFGEYHGVSNPTSQVGLAFTAESMQSFNATFNVYVGAIEGFAENWENDSWGCNPGYGKFAVQREITNEAGDVVSCTYKILEDFPNDEKYPLIYETIEGTLDGYIMHFSWNYTDTFDFSTIESDNGKIEYFILYYDDVKEEALDGNIYLYGISWGDGLHFEKKENEVFFAS